MTEINKVLETVNQSKALGVTWQAINDLDEFDVALTRRFFPAKPMDIAVLKTGEVLRWNWDESRWYHERTIDPNGRRPRR